MPTTVYRLGDGILVPSVTQAIKHLDKPALVPWANQLGLRGIRVRNELERTAKQGTDWHREWIAMLVGFDVSALEDTKHLHNLRAWTRDHRVRSIYAVERHFVSPTLRLGGTPDIILDIDGQDTVLDLKSAKQVYVEHLYQVSAYRYMVLEEGRLIRGPLRAAVLALGGERPDYQEADPAKYTAYVGIVEHMARVHELLEEIECGNKGTRKTGH